MAQQSTREEPHYRVLRVDWKPHPEHGIGAKKGVAGNESVCHELLVALGSCGRDGTDGELIGPASGQQDHHRKSDKALV
jgi:hypothetical protein